MLAMKAFLIVASTSEYIQPTQKLFIEAYEPLRPHIKSHPIVQLTWSTGDPKRVHPHAVNVPYCCLL